MAHTGRTMCFRLSTVACKSLSSSCTTSLEILNTSGAAFLALAQLHSSSSLQSSFLPLLAKRPQERAWHVVGIRMATAFTREDFFIPTAQGIDTLNTRHANTMLAQVGSRLLTSDTVARRPCVGSSIYDRLLWSSHPLHGMRR